MTLYYEENEHTLDGSVVTSFLPPASRVLIIRMFASLFSERRSSRIGMSIDWEDQFQHQEWRRVTATYPSFLDQPLESILLAPHICQILRFFATKVVQ